MHRALRGAGMDAGAGDGLRDVRSVNEEREWRCGQQRQLATEPPARNPGETPPERGHIPDCITTLQLAAAVLNDEAASNSRPVPSMRTA
jgi:hypothetical protein